MHHLEHLRSAVLDDSPQISWQKSCVAHAPVCQGFRLPGAEERVSGEDVKSSD